MVERPSLRERKQQRAREAIIEAAYELFAERGFTAVTVADIAERAEVGRTTFFRYFGDKQEVVFADEQHLLDQLVARYRTPRPERNPTLVEALAQIRPAVTMLCDEVTRNAKRYVAHERLLEQNPELHDRAMRKLQGLADAMRGILREQGASEWTAALAPQLAFACYQAARHVAGPDPEALTPAVNAALQELQDSLK